MFEACHSTSFDALVISWASDPARRIPSNIKERLIGSAVRALKQKHELHCPLTANSSAANKVTSEDRSAIRAIDALLHSMDAGRSCSQQSCVPFTFVSEGALVVRK